LARLNADLERTEMDAAQLTSSLETLSGLAQNISGRVAVLDLGKSRVVECLQRVNDLKDLGTCTSGVQEAIRAENFEEAARHIHRFLTLDSAVFKMGDNPEAKGLRDYKILPVDFTNIFTYRCRLFRQKFLRSATAGNNRIEGNN
jgi:hypothetical protein